MSDPTTTRDRTGVLAYISQLARRFDAWSSDVIGIGVAARDKTFDARFGPGLALPDIELAALYDCNYLMARIVDLLPDETLRKGIGLTIRDDDGSMNTELASATLTRLGELGAANAVVGAHKWSRALRGGAVFLDVDDGSASAEEPLREQSIRSVRALRVIARTELQIDSAYADERHPRWGMPAVYTWTPRTLATSGLPRKVHESRLVVIDGKPVTPDRRLQYRGWGAAEADRIYELLRDFGLSWAAVSQLMMVSSQAVYTMRGLIDAIASGEKDVLEERMRLTELWRSIAKGLLLDAGDEKGLGAEKFELHSVSWAGIPDLLDRWQGLLAAATGYPITILFGRAPAGLNATGESDSQTWEKLVGAEQARVTRPALERIARIVFLSQDGPTRGREPAQWELTFPPLRVPTPKEQSEERKAVAETDRTYIEAGVVLPEEVATSRFRAEGWSAEMTIDLEARRALLEGDTERRALLAAGEPDTTQEPAAGEPAEQQAPEEPAVPEAKDPASALNGAQIAEMRETIAAVARRELPRETGVMILASAFPFDEQQAERIMGAVGRAPAPAFVAKPPPSAQEPPQGESRPDDEDEPNDQPAGAPAAPGRPRRVGARAGRREDAGTTSSTDIVRLDAGEPRGAMVALFLEPATAARFAQPGGTPPDDLHVTLAYLGPAEAIPPVSIEAVRTLLRPIARAESGPLQAWLSGVGTFAPTGGSDGAPVSYLSVDAPWLPRLREAVIDACRATPMVAPSEAHGFTPHITLAYGGHVLDRVPFDAPVPVTFNALALCVGADRERFVFGDAPESRRPTLDAPRMAAATEIVMRVGRSEIPRDSGVALLAAGLRLSREEAEQVMGDVGRLRGER